MRYTFNDINDALDEVSAHSSGGAPFLIAYTVILFFIAVTYWITNPLVYRHANRLTKSAA